MSEARNTAVLFDMDGVLTNSEPVIEAAATMGLKEFGVDAKHEDFIPFIGAGEDRYIGGVAEKYGIPYHLEMKARVYEIYLEIVGEQLKIYAGAGELLDKLHRDGWTMALASSSDLVKIEANLRVAGIPMAIFTAVLSGNDVVHKKPDPEIYLKAARKVGVPPSRCIVVEDAVNGIQAAKAAGMKCIAVVSTFPREALERERPDHICGGIAAAYEVLRRI